MSWDSESFKQKLEAEHRFPGSYLFKFIVPIYQKETLLALLPKGKLSFKNSAAGNYISVTLDTHVDTSQSVVEVYQQVYSIDGIVTL